MKSARQIIMVLTLSLGFALAAQAQYAHRADSDDAEGRLYREPSGFSLDKLFSPEFFRMGHSYEMSYSSFGGQGLSMGTYTNSMMWRFSTKLAARVDVAVQHAPFGVSGLSNGLPVSQSNLSGVYLRNAEVAYQPLRNLTMHLSVRQAPYGYGSYLSPYGRYGYSNGYDRYGLRGGFGDPYFNN
jgi:hypothetical protein